MRMMMKVSIPVVPGNKGIQDGTLPKTMMAFVEQNRPEAAYFVADGGKRTAYFVFDMKDNAALPSLAEGFFMNLEADISITPAMNVEDMKSGIERAAKNR